MHEHKAIQAYSCKLDFTLYTHISYICTTARYKNPHNNENDNYDNTNYGNAYTHTHSLGYHLVYCKPRVVHDPCAQRSRGVSNMQSKHIAHAYT